ncbi:hypothetical protein PILCRDRAFT_388485 [Piloderma croceum F 1598]|uniref:Nephrocystin 3-like N-terminal domain-containing protein n=1 Tax=Piloderma croceum (strain F 1598) TaxID=765440 RepID=A0A0C3FJF2_PILCF|nr:hypothetical protein PILCRDRAFT_388485 [Piloderma croceum F 1598]
MTSPNPNNIDARGGTFNNFRDMISIVHTENLDLNKLLAPVDAAYNRSGPVVRCLHGTREKLIEKIVQWMDEDNGRPICWLNGPAGSGKSAVSQTVAEWCDEQDRLASSFFFFRGSGDRSKIERFIPTLSYHLSISVPSTTPFIQQILHRDPSIAQRSLSHQFKKLMVEPIRAARGPNLAAMKPLVIVIDALDECDDKELIVDFIIIVGNACQNDCNFPFRVFFASRVEEYLRKKLETRAIYSLALQDFDASSDIRKFFQSRFSTIYEENHRLMRNIPWPWPSDRDLDALVRKASGSFIFAFTLINFVDDGSQLPHRKLPIALTAHAGLDPLYTQILSSVSHGEDFKRIITTLTLLKSPLSVTSLGRLLQLETVDILHNLLEVQSILRIPSHDDQPILPYHASLRDFLTRESRSGDFFIDPPSGHIIIATKCLKVLEAFPEDGCFFIGEVQKYACNNWCYHLHQALIEEGDSHINLLADGFLMSCLTTFSTQSLQFWINTLILRHQWQVLGVLHSLILKLEMLQHIEWCAEQV